MTTSRAKTKQSYQVQVTYTNVLAYANIAATSLEDAVEQSRNLKFGTMLADGLSEIIDYDAHVSGVFEGE